MSNSPSALASLSASLVSICVPTNFIPLKTFENALEKIGLLSQEDFQLGVFRWEAFLFWTLIISFVRFSFEWIFRLVAKRLKAPASEHEKFGQSMFKIVFYGSAWLWEIMALEQGGWWLNTMSIWLQYPQQPLYLTLSLYVWQICWYLSALFYLVFLEPRLKDFWVMFVHHIVTIILLCYSHYFQLHSLGVMVLMVHDLNDVFLEGAKAATNISRKGFWNHMSTINFVFLLISWFIFRLYLFPFHVIGTIWTEAVYYFQVNPTIDIWLGHWYTFVALLGTLFVFHIYWFVLICKIAIRAVNGSLEDIREEDD